MARIATKAKIGPRTLIFIVFALQGGKAWEEWGTAAGMEPKRMLILLHIPVKSHNRKYFFDKESKLSEIGTLNRKNLAFFGLATVLAEGSLHFPGIGFQHPVEYERPDFLYRFV